ncbi:uncharacterized protein LTR77_009955 [Saxophila tyrrhenica]|uniref:Heterokaryon incompatibility domain-containing protein n=1 Tax=Saxophila tyrrhenica TaxID=1690608 RepID=A0AAV9NWT2_9PEZI|nr:hypothetical protein LTR77_009955 [Saxophila tyrrhenica]
MRLLNIHTLELEEFFEQNIPPYFILSHRWQGKEVTYKDFVKGRCSRDSPGYRKILECCNFVKEFHNSRYIRSFQEHPEGALRDAMHRDKLQWVWIDTCCIDKRSSAELSEAINSMFAWYQNAVVCIAYLSDVYSLTGSGSKAFKNSEWFRRGWTLQELLAPSVVVFCDVRWEVLGYLDKAVYPARGRCSRTAESKLAPLLTEKVSSATGIAERYLSKLRGTECSVWHASIAERMSWAADRKTTRKEDASYCLLGIFNVNMPLLYGEGSKAFHRLQEAIIQSSNDKSIFDYDDTYFYDGP